MSKVAILIVLSLLLWQKECVQGQEEASTCSNNFSTLVSRVVTPERNQYNMQMAFFPPDTANPVYVTVRYIFEHEDYDDYNMLPEKVWFWSESTYYASFHPLRIYQYTSLFFGDFVFRKQSLDLTVKVNDEYMDCHNASDDFMMLLTQRMKLFAKSGKGGYGSISDSYNPKAESARTVQMYHAEHRAISRLLMSAQVIFPLIVLAWSILLLFYYLHHKKLATHFIDPAKGRKETLVADEEGNKANKINVEDMKAKLSILSTLSFMFSFYTLMLSVVAWTDGNNKLDNDTQKWYNNEDTSEVSTLYGIIIVILIEDILIFLTLLVGGTVSALVLRGKFWWLFCACSVVAPALNLSVHANHIVFAFIHNQEHAVSVGIFYGIVIITNVHIMHIVSSLINKKDFMWTIPLVNLGLSVLINGLYAYIATIYILLPINNAFDAAPDRIRLIYNSLIVSFVAAFAYWFFVKKKETQKLETEKPQGAGRIIQQK